MSTKLGTYLNRSGKMSSSFDKNKLNAQMTSAFSISSAIKIDFQTDDYLSANVFFV